MFSLFQEVKYHNPGVQHEIEMLMVIQKISLMLHHFSQSSHNVWYVLVAVPFVVHCEVGNVIQSFSNCVGILYFKFYVVVLADKGIEFLFLLIFL